MIKKISKELNKELEDIGIDMLPQFVENLCPECDCEMEDCKCKKGSDK